MIDVSNILTSHISLCQNIRSKSYQIITLFEALNNIRKAIYEKQIANLRQLLSDGNICSYRAKRNNCPRTYSQALPMVKDINLTLVATLR